MWSSGCKNESIGNNYVPYEEWKPQEIKITPDIEALLCCHCTWGAIMNKQSLVCSEAAAAQTKAELPVWNESMVGLDQTGGTVLFFHRKLSYIFWI